MNFSVFLVLLLAQSQQFQVVGEVVSKAKQRFEWAEIESIDRRFVDYTGIDLTGKFLFKKIPEGLYKVTAGGAGGRQHQRTIEVRPAFADARGRITVKLEIKDRPLTQDQLTVGLAGLAVSPKAVEEVRRAYQARGDVEKARRHLQQAIEISPNFDEALNNLGTYYYRDGRFETAANLFQRALRSNPNLFSAQVNLGGALISFGDYPRALEENLKALAMRPDDSLALSQTGQALFYLKRYDEAIPHLERARQLDPMSFTLPGLFIAQIRQIEGDKEGAIAEYKEFLRIHPGHPSTAFVERQLLDLGVTPNSLIELIEKNQNARFTSGWPGCEAAPLARSPRPISNPTLLAQLSPTVGRATISPRQSGIGSAPALQLASTTQRGCTRVRISACFGYRTSDSMTA